MFNFQSNKVHVYFNACLDFKISLCRISTLTLFLYKDPKHNTNDDECIKYWVNSDIPLSLCISPNAHEFLLFPKLSFVNP